VERRLGGMDHMRNIDFAFKKLDLKTLTKPATNAGRTAANVNGTIEKPKH
jgi:hypothetical protein